MTRVYRLNRRQVPAAVRGIIARPVSSVMTGGGLYVIGGAAVRRHAARELRQRSGILPLGMRQQPQQVRTPVPAHRRAPESPRNMREHLIERLRPRGMPVNGPHPRPIHGPEQAELRNSPDSPVAGRRWPYDY